MQASCNYEHKYKSPVISKKTTQHYTMGLLKTLNCIQIFIGEGRDSSVGIATAYGVDGSGIESRWGRDFPHLSRPALRPTQPPVQWVTGLPGCKVRPEHDANPSPPSSAEVKNRVELYLYSP